MKKFIYTLLFASLSVGVYAQKSNGTTKSLVETEKAFAADLAKNGSNATTSAVKLARAYTGKEIVLRCFDQPFFSISAHIS